MAKGPADEFLGTSVLPGGNCHFLFGFTAWVAGYELGDIAWCYGYVDADTGEGWFSWNCH